MHVRKQRTAERGGARPPDAGPEAGPQPGSTGLGGAAGLGVLSTWDPGKWLWGETPSKCANRTARRGGRRGNLGNQGTLEPGAFRFLLGGEAARRVPWSRASMGKAGPWASGSTGRVGGLLGPGPAGRSMERKATTKARFVVDGTRVPTHFAVAEPPGGG